MQGCGHLNGGHTFLFPFYSKSRVQDTRLGVNLGNNGYSYDAMGRIVANTYTAKDGSSNYRTYTYDEFGQLVRENNEALDKTFVYEYNNIGNVTKVTVYGYTEGALGSVLSSKTFDYNAAKKDQLAVYNGSMLTYDANGCLKTAPGTVMNTSGTVTYGWTGGRLTSASWGSNHHNACTYAYDGYGRRINKTHTVTVLGGSIPSQTIKSTGYTYDQGGRLICERISTSSTAGSISTEEKFYLYDEASVVGMIYTANGTTNTYYFDKDVFGNVLGIHNAQGIQQCRYVYDAFGNCKVLNPDGTVNISSTFIGNINPFRYKGYYYDKETCLYYLGTRYYCPDLCRFIQPADVSGLIPSTVNGLNLYAFANNNPIVIIYLGLNAVHGTYSSQFYATNPIYGGISFSDEDEAGWVSTALKIAGGVTIIAVCSIGSMVTGGALSVILAGAAIGAITGGMSAGISTAISGGDIHDFANAFLMSTATGAISGAFGAMGLPRGALGIINAGCNVLSYWATQSMNGDPVTVDGLVVTAALGFVAGNKSGYDRTIKDAPIKAFIRSGAIGYIKGAKFLIDFDDLIINLVASVHGGLF